jgi:transposase
MTRTDSTHVLAAVWVLSRLALVAETLRAALHDVATVAPQWLQALAPVEWYKRYGKRIEDSRLPRAKGARDAYAQAVGADGFRVLEAVDAPEAPEAVRTLASLTTLRRIWQRHSTRTEPPRSATRKRPGPRVRFKSTRALPRAAEAIASPYDTEARYRHKRDTRCAALGCGMPGIGAPPKPTCSTSRRPPRSLSIDSWPGSMSVRGRRRGPPGS